MVCSLYVNDVAPITTTRVRLSIEDKKERQREIQRSYYKRRGAFLGYRRRLEKKLDLKANELTHIDTLVKLEAFSKNWLFTQHGLDIKENQTFYLMFFI